MTIDWEARATALEAERANLTRQLLGLATIIHQKHYSEAPQWQPLPDAEGLLSQIDNMTTGLSRSIPAPADGRGAGPTDIGLVLHLFRGFVIQNVTQWKVGAGDHHHPIWALVAEALGPLNDAGVAPNWRFIQPENREPLAAPADAKSKDLPTEARAEGVKDAEIAVLNAHLNSLALVVAGIEDLDDIDGFKRLLTKWEDAIRIRSTLTVPPSTAQTGDA